MTKRHLQVGPVHDRVVVRSIESCDGLTGRLNPDHCIQPSARDTFAACRDAF